MIKDACNYINNFLFSRPILVNSLPKSGTNLLRKTVLSIPGILAYEGKEGIHHSSVPEKSISGDTSRELPVGVDMPRMISFTSLDDKISKLGRGEMMTSHIPFSKEANEILSERGVSVVNIIRDPRSVALSHANFVRNAENHPLYEIFKQVDLDTAIMYSIEGVNKKGYPRLLSIGDRYKSVLEWRKTENSIIVRFEDLVGPMGGGEREKQIRTLDIISSHIGCTWSRDKMLESAKDIYGGTETFEKGVGGKINSWKNNLSKKHLFFVHQEVGHVIDKLDY